MPQHWGENKPVRPMSRSMRAGLLSFEDPVVVDDPSVRVRPQDRPDHDLLINGDRIVAFLVVRCLVFAVGVGPAVGSSRKHPYFWVLALERVVLSSVPSFRDAHEGPVERKCVFTPRLGIRDPGSLVEHLYLLDDRSVSGNVQCPAAHLLVLFPSTSKWI